jgi:hypothetical protein
MQTIIDGRFATPEETAETLGVPRSRLKKLLTITRSILNGDGAPGANGHTAKRRNKSYKVQLNFEKQSGAAKKSPSRKRHARGKLAKASR